MFRTTLKNLAARKLRLLTTSIAVLLGVAFMAGTLVLTDTIGKSFDTLLADANKGTDAYLRGELALDNEMLGEQRARLDTSMLEAVRNVDGVAAAEGHIEAYAQLVDKDGKPLGNPEQGAPVLGGAWLDTAELNAFDIAEGRAPERDLEVVIDKGSATRGELAVGDTAVLLTQDGPLEVAVVGIATFAGEDSPGGAGVTMLTHEAAQAHLTQPGKVDAIKVLAEDGVDATELVGRIAAVVPDTTDVLTGAEITAEEQASIKSEMGFMNVFLMVFALIALFVGSFIIYNSFSILVAQRSKEMAMMRAIGARRRQVLGSVLAEATVVGLIASGLGLVAGIGVASGLKALLAGMGIDLPAGSVVIKNSTVLISVIAGVGVSIASAVFPARRASKVPPIAAMRDVALDTSGSSRKRAFAGFGITGFGVAAMAAGLFGDAGIALVGLGAMVVFVGVAVLGPITAAPLSRLIGVPLPRLKGMPGTLARENAMRNPKRTSATAAALMIGVALVGAITVLASSTKASVRSSVEESFKGDLVVDSGSWGIPGGFSTDLAPKLAALPELAAVTPHRQAAAEVDGHSSVLDAFDVAALPGIMDIEVTSGSVDQLGPTRLAVFDDLATDYGWSVGDIVPVRFAETGEQQFTIGAIFSAENTVGDYLISLAAYEANVPDLFDVELLATAADGVDLETARAAVTTVTDAYPQAEVLDRDEYIALQTETLDMILNLIYALLGLAVLIALLGIANTLALSIFERTRELGLLRAVGMTRSQLRATVRYEAVIIALLGTGMGLAIGTGFGWAIVKALDGEGLDTFQLPVTSLVVLTVVGAIAGVGAALLPARRAAKLNVLGAIVSE
jgi:putative ABC transport system permease protein